MSGLLQKIVSGVLKKGDVKRPVLPKETVTVPELGGDVVVRGLLLSERLAIFSPREGVNQFAHIGELLAATVVDCAGEAIFTATEWEEFGAKDFSAALNLFQVARRLSGLDVEVQQKN